MAVFVLSKLPVITVQWNRLGIWYLHT